MVKKLLTSCLVALGVAGALPAAAQQVQETLTVPFDVPNGATTTNSYDGTVRITVSGIGQSDGNLFNDAFYIVGGTLQDANYYQLAFGTSELQAYDSGNAAYQFVSGGRPAYSATNTYTFLLNTGLATPGQLHFGVTDGQFGDNTGAYALSVTSVPEPATWAMMLLGFGMIGFGLRARRKAAVRVTYA